MGVLSMHRPQHGACPPAAPSPGQPRAEDMPSLRGQEWAYGHYVHAPAPALGMSPGQGRAKWACPLGCGPRSCAGPCCRSTAGDKVVDVPHWQDPPPKPATWQRCDAGILPLWWDRLCSQTSQQSAALFAAGLFTEDRRRPIAQWYNPAVDSALLVAPESSPEWPVQRFGIFYAPPGGGFTQVHSAPHEWHPREPRTSPTELEAFRAAVAEAERFLQVEMYFV